MLPQAYVGSVSKKKDMGALRHISGFAGTYFLFSFVSLWDYFARGIRGNKGKFGLLRLPGHILVEDI